MQVQTPTLSLNDKQRLAFYSPANELLYGGAAGGGKSLLLRISAIRWCDEVPGVQIYLFRRTFPDLRDNHLRGPSSFFTLLGDRLDKDVKYNKQENEFIFKNGSRISLCHCQYEDDVAKYQGAEIHVLMMDELTHFTEYQYRFLRGRVRCIGLKVPEVYRSYIPRIETGSNPGSVGHAWVKRAFIRSPVDIYKASPDEGGMMRQYIPARLSDNPALLKDDPTYEQRLDGLGSPALVRAMKDGDWDIFAGQFFDNWRRDIHVLPRDFKIEPWWNRFGGYDHGHNHPYVFGAYAVDGDGNVIKYAECGDRGRKPDQIIEEIASIVPEFIGSNKPVYAGHDLWVKGRDGSPEIVERFHGKLSMVKAHIDRKTGADQLRNYFDWRKDENGLFTKRPRFFIKENCWRSIQQIPAMIYDDKDLEDVLKVDATENDVWGGDDAYDECFIEGTLVSTCDGETPIEKINVGDLVWTRDGLKPVLANGSTGEKPVITVSFSNGRTLTGTANHPIFVRGIGWKSLDAIRYGDMLVSCQKLSNIRAENIAETQIQDTDLGGSISTIVLKKTALSQAQRFIALFGKIISERFQMGITSITEMITHLTMPLRILSVSEAVNISGATRKKILQGQNTWRKYERLPQNGTGLMRVLNSIANWVRKLGIKERLSALNVSFVKQVMRPVQWVNQNSVLTVASQGGGDLKELTILKWFVKHVRKFLRQIGLNQSKVVQENVVRALGSCLAGTATVYNLTVADSPEYFANGILVHNCRYAIMSRPRLSKQEPRVAKRGTMGHFLDRFEKDQKFNGRLRT